MRLRIYFLVTLLIFCGLYMQAQLPPYPKNYFRNPMGIPIELSANFGELRPNHWHMGLDIRTKQRENLPVYAAAQGYIAKIGIRPQSFGRFIIINHPNGLSTLYGHLNDFYPDLEKYVTGQQYKQESWAMELELTKEKFPVSKGQFIAYSGNTGGSQGPHLHFEIFDTKTTKRLNPLLFDFGVKDNIPPALVKLALYDRSRSVYDQSPLFYPVKNTDSGYIIPKTPVLKVGTNRVSFALQAYDRVSGSTNPNGVYAAKLYVDDQPQVAFILDSIDYDETVYMNAHVDYMHKHNGGAWLQHLSVMPGERGAAYKKLNGDGVIILPDTSLYAIRIDVKDAAGNTSQLNFQVQYSDSITRPILRQEGAIYFAPAEKTILTKPDFEVHMATGSLYDTVKAYYFRNNSSETPNTISALHQLNDASIPVHESFTVRIRPYYPIPDKLKEKVLLQRTYRNNKSVRKANWQGDWLTADFDDFGSFQAFIDTVPPRISDLNNEDTINLSASTRIVFTPTDNFGVVKNFRAELNGRWIRFTNDKTRNWIYEFDERCPYGVHQLKVTAEDLVGNITTKLWLFKRNPYTPPPKKKTIKKASSTKKKNTSAKKAPVKKKS
ncbi:MAG TPA: M23 family metallopeptidase [Chitinophagaceae bacterium]|nr:M23 family metallopeptidase [Chitinophagaceae bacterium]HNU12811.1 M23 family metallopeptidase [Chitinophagaceae bacterium]